MISTYKLFEFGGVEDYVKAASKGALVSVARDNFHNQTDKGSVKRAIGGAASGVLGGLLAATVGKKLMYKNNDD